MNKITIKVPFGIKFISDWKEYNYPEGHCIVDKGVTGCGYTEYCLRNDRNIILCSPRKILLENKEEKHKEEGNDNIIYLKNEIGEYQDIGILENTIATHIVNCKCKHKPVKFMITYDSVGYLIDYLLRNNRLQEFSLVADEFQSIFLDSYFKVNVENEFLRIIQKCSNIIYLSATPMLDKYLEMLDEFKDLDQYYIDWSESGYVENLLIQDKQTRSLSEEINKIVRAYLEGDFPITVTENNEIVKSTEAVFYFNSVTEIVKAINKNGLTPDQVNIICSDTEANRKKLKRIGHMIGKIPMEGQPNKMFTFCTSTCYIGADFYSKCASTYIFADPNLKWLALDISIDLPQIAGRQRDRENPFKNNITIFYKTLRKDKEFSKEAFDEIQKERTLSTYDLINLWNKGTDVEKEKFAKKIKSDIQLNNYCDDYAAVSSDSGAVVYNKLIEVANERAWEVSQRDYRDSISVTKALESLDEVIEVKEFKDKAEKIIDEFLINIFNKTGIFAKKLRAYCQFMDKYKDDMYVKKLIRYKISDVRYYNYYVYFGTIRCSALEFKDANLHQAIMNETRQDILLTSIYNQFEVGKKYLMKDIKEILSCTYEKLEISRAPKATDIEEWFEVKRTQITDPLTKRRDHGYEILKKKGG